MHCITFINKKYRTLVAVNPITLFDNEVGLFLTPMGSAASRICCTPIFSFMWYKIKDIPETKNLVVYKIWYAKKYVIIGGKSMFRSVNNINTGLLYFFKDTTNGRNPNDMYYNFYCHVDDFPFQEFKIEVIFNTENTYYYLKNLFIELQKGKEDSQCLNLYFEPYIPKNTQRKSKSWINRGHYLNYMKWKKNVING